MTLNIPQGSITYRQLAGGNVIRYAYRLVPILAILLTGCATSSKAGNFSGLESVDGPNPVHINMTKYAVHLFAVQPLLGDATLERTVEEFTQQAKDMGKSKVRIVQSDETWLWWIFPPISFIVTPVWTNVAGDAVP